MTVRTPRRLLPLVAALLVAACGSGSPHSSSSTTAAASRTSESSPAGTVRHALSSAASASVYATGSVTAALSRREFEVRFREAARLHLAGVPSARTRALEAQLRGAALSETGVVHFTSIRQFQATLCSTRSGTADVKVSGGAFLVSINGGGYRAATAVERRVLTAFVRGGFSFVSPPARHVEDKGPASVDGVAVEEYTGSFSPGAVTAQFSPFVRLPPHTSVAGGTTTLDVDRATGLPVHISDVVLLRTDLAAVSPGLTGRLITTATSIRTFRFDATR